MPTADPDLPTGERGARPAPAWSAVGRLVSRPWTTVLLCLAGLVLILLLDRALQARPWSVPVTALLDEPAHLVTAGLVLLAFLPWRARGLARWALAGAVLIDLDHAPLYLWGALTVDGHGRPITHSLTTVLVLALLGLAGRRSLRTALLGLSLGVALHLVRDVVTGPGVDLWWPVATHSVLLPYPAYVVAMAVVTAVAVGRQARRALTGSPRAAATELATAGRPRTGPVRPGWPRPRCPAGREASARRPAGPTRGRPGAWDDDPRS